MRHITPAQIISQANLLRSLISSSPHSHLDYHREELVRFFKNFYDRFQVTHSVSPRFPDRSLERLNPLLTTLQSTDVSIADPEIRKMVDQFLEDIIDRRIKVLPTD